MYACLGERVNALWVGIGQMSPKETEDTWRMAVESVGSECIHKRALLASTMLLSHNGMVNFQLYDTVLPLFQGCFPDMEQWMSFFLEWTVGVLDQREAWLGVLVVEQLIHSHAMVTAQSVSSYSLERLLRHSCFQSLWDTSLLMSTNELEQLRFMDYCIAEEHVVGTCFRQLIMPDEVL